MTRWHWILGAVLVGACGSAQPAAPHQASGPAPSATPAPAGVAPARTAAPPATASSYQPPYWPSPLGKRRPGLPIPETIARRARDVMESLDGVRGFALGGVGVTGAISGGEELTRTLAEQPDAVAAFSWLAAHGHPVARLYAYWALRTLAPDRAAAFAAALEADRTAVEVAYGCLGGQSRVGSIARGMKDRKSLVGRAMRRP